MVWALEQLVAYEVVQKELVRARAGQVVVEVVFRRERVLDDCDEASVWCVVCVRVCVCCVTLLVVVRVVSVTMVAKVRAIGKAKGKSGRLLVKLVGVRVLGRAPAGARVGG